MSEESVAQYEARRREMADDAARQLLDVTRKALAERGFRELFEPIVGAPMAPNLGAPAFSLKGTIESDEYRVHVRTAFNIARADLPGTIRFGVHEVHMEIVRKVDSATGNAQFEPKFSQTGDDVTILVPEAIILELFDGTVSGLPPATST